MIQNKDYKLKMIEHHLAQVKQMIEYEVLGGQKTFNPKRFVHLKESERYLQEMRDDIKMQQRRQSVIGMFCEPCKHTYSKDSYLCSICKNKPE